MNSKAQESLRLGKFVVECMKQRDHEPIIPILHDNVLLEVVFPFIKGEDKTGTRYQHGNAVVAAHLRESTQRTSEVKFDNETWRTTDDGWAIFQADSDITLADGRPFPQSYLFMFESFEGKIIRWLEYYNPVCAARAYGVTLDSVPYAT